MADTRVVFPACPCPMRARLRRLAASYTFTGCLLPQAYGKGATARNEDEYRLQASPKMPAKLLMLTQGVGRNKGRVSPPPPPTLHSRLSPGGRPPPFSPANMSCRPDIKRTAG